MSYSYQPVIVSNSHREVLSTLKEGSYMICVGSKIATLFARTAKNFGLMCPLLSKNVEPKVPGRLYGRFDGKQLIFEERLLNGSRYCSMTIGEATLPKAAPFISRLIQQENGGQSCNESMRIQIEVAGLGVVMRAGARILLDSSCPCSQLLLSSRKRS